MAVVEEQRGLERSAFGLLDRRLVRGRAHEAAHDGDLRFTW
jgi:hypothetical protein